MNKKAPQAIFSLKLVMVTNSQVLHIISLISKSAISFGDLI